MSKKSTAPFKISKGILSNKKTATVKKGNNPSPVRKPSQGRKMC